MNRLFDEIVICGRMPRNADGSIDLLTIGKLITELTDNNHKVAVMQRVLDRAAGLRSADEWLKDPEFEDITVMDRDGWDRSNYEASWAEKITRHEFKRRLAISTSNWRRPH